MPVNQIHDRYLDVLFERAGLDGHPSPGMLDRLQSALVDRDDVEDYAKALIDNLERTRYPSPQLLDRTLAVVRLLIFADRTAGESRPAS